MYFRLLVICGAASLFVLLLQDWDRASPRADFRYLNKSDVHSLDPAQMSWTQDFRVAMNIWEGLTTNDPETTAPQEGAAAFPPEISGDGLTYTFHLNDRGRWSNGDPVVAGDFVRGWRRVIEPGTAADYAGLLLDHVSGARAYFDSRIAATKTLADLASSAAMGNADAVAAHRWALEQYAALMDAEFDRVGVRALDDLTLEVRLSSPCAFFLDLCAFSTLMPIHSSIELLRERYADLPIGDTGLVTYDSQWTKPDYHRNGYPGLVTNGAYRLRDWTFKRRLLMEVNPFYRDASAIECRVVEAVVYDELNSALMAYEAGQLDFLTDLEVDYVHELVRLSREGLRRDIQVPTVFGTYYFIFNCESELSDGLPNPLADARVRKALAISVDKQLLVDKVLNKGDPAANHLVPVGTIPGYGSGPAAEYDPALARELLAEAGYPGGQELPVIEVLYNTGYQHGKVSEVLADMWQKELGIRVTLIGKEAKTFSEDKVNRRFMVARAGWYGDYGDPTTFLDIFITGNGNNDAGFSNRHFDELMQEAAAMRNPADRLAKLAEAESLLLSDQFPVIPLYQYTNPLAIQPWVEGLHSNARLIFPFKHVRVKR